MLATSAIRAIIIGITALLIGYGSYIFGPALLSPLTDIKLEPQRGTVVVGETFPVTVVVSSQEPVNVFQGELVFDESVLQIVSIDYNTSIATLWAERPWYENGEGTLNFIGGTTAPGGFVGTGDLITITFRSIAPGNATISMREARILKHDGLGSDAALGLPLDAVFSIETTSPPRIVVEKTATGPVLTILQQTPSTDLNGDGVHDIFDISIFMSDLATQNKRSDFNLDGGVDLRDLSILRSVR